MADTTVRPVLVTYRQAPTTLSFVRLALFTFGFGVIFVWFWHTLEFTTHSVRLSVGWWNRVRRELEYSEIENVSSHDTRLTRFLGYGDVLFSGRGHRDADIAYPQIQCPERVIKTREDISADGAAELTLVESFVRRQRRGIFSVLLFWGAGPSIFVLLSILALVAHLPILIGVVFVTLTLGALWAMVIYPKR